MPIICEDIGPSVVSGCNIKQIREETATFIKTPWREEAPVFVVTGRAMDVARAKQRLLLEADRISQQQAAKCAQAVSAACPSTRLL